VKLAAVLRNSYSRLGEMALYLHSSVGLKKLC